MTRVRQAILLVRPLLRTVPLVPLPAAALCGLLVLSLDGDPVTQLRLAAIALCAGAAFTLDDAAATITESAPTSRLFRRLLRVALVAPLAAGLWTALLAYAGEDPRTAVTVELAALLGVTLAAAALAVPFVPDGRSGLAATPAVLVFVALAALALPDGWTLFASGPNDPVWVSSHGRWAAVLVFGLLGFLHASRDPGRRPLRRRLLARRA